MSFPLIAGWDFHPGWVSSVEGTILDSDQVLLKGRFGNRDPSNGHISVFEEPALLLKEWASSLSGQSLKGSFEMSNTYPYPEDYNDVRWVFGPLTSDAKIKEF